MPGLLAFIRKLRLEPLSFLGTDAPEIMSSVMAVAPMPSLPSSVLHVPFSVKSVRVAGESSALSSPFDDSF